jgi:hypothetical protein
MPFNFTYPEERNNPEYEFSSILSGYNFNFTLIESLLTGGTSFDSLSATSLSAETLYVANEIWTIELMDVQTVDFYAPYDMTINSYETVLSATTIYLFDDDVTYTTGNTISIGSKITVSGASATVINLNTTH